MPQNASDPNLVARARARASRRAEKRKIPQNGGGGRTARGGARVIVRDFSAGRVEPHAPPLCIRRQRSRWHRSVRDFHVNGAATHDTRAALQVRDLWESQWKRGGKEIMQGRGGTDWYITEGDVGLDCCSDHHLRRTKHTQSQLTPSPSETLTKWPAAVTTLLLPRTPQLHLPSGKSNAATATTMRVDEAHPFSCPCVLRSLIASQHMQRRQVHLRKGCLQLQGLPKLGQGREDDVSMWRVSFRPAKEIRRIYRQNETDIHPRFPLQRHTVTTATAHAQLVPARALPAQRTPPSKILVAGDRPISCLLAIFM